MAAASTAESAWAMSRSAGLMGATALAMVALATLGWRRRHVNAMPWLVGGLLCTTWWAAAYTLELTAPLSQVQLWGSLKYVGIVALPPVWWSFVLAFTRQRPLSRRALVLLACEPVLVLGLLASPRTDQLVRYYADPASRVATSGPVFWLHVAYTGLLLWAGTAVLVASLWRQPHVHRRRAQLLVATLVVPYLLNLLYNFGVAPFDTVDLTPFALLASEVLLLWGIAGLAPDLRGFRRAAVFEITREPVLVLDGRGRVVDANPAAERVLGRPLPDLVGDDVTIVVPDVVPALAAVAPASQVELHLAGRTYDVTVTRRTDRKGHVTSALLTAHDVTERKATEREFERRSQHDPLTGLPNREVFLRRLATATASPTNVGVLYVDVDGFKSVNDTHGHLVGDAVLVEVATRLRRSVREQDLVARLAGDEFAVLLGDLRDAEQLTVVAGHVVEAFRTPTAAGGEWLEVHVSVGGALGAAVRDAELLARADSAMYAAKNTGRNRFEIWQPAPPGGVPAQSRGRGLRAKGGR